MNYPTPRRSPRLRLWGLSLQRARLRRQDGQVVAPPGRWVTVRDVASREDAVVQPLQPEGTVLPYQVLFPTLDPAMVDRVLGLGDDEGDSARRHQA